MSEKRVTAGRWRNKTLPSCGRSQWLLRARVAAGVAIAAAFGHAAAQTLPDTSLSCLNPSLGQMAVAEDAQSADERWPTPPATASNSCWVDLATVSATVVSPTWIDVRTAAGARAASLPGALAIPLAELRTKQFLQGMPIVLIGSGRDDADLARACGELKRAGFRQVQLLRGGIRSWIGDRRPILDDGGVLQSLDLISPAEFHRQAAGAPWQVIGVDLEPTEATSAAMSGLERIDSRNVAARALDAIRKRQTDMAKVGVVERPTAIVVVARDEASATRLRDAMRGGDYRDVLVLQGGLAAYRAFLAQQQGIAAAAGKSLARVCGSG